MRLDEHKAEGEGLDVVLVGSFNPAIFHPEWFLRHELVGAEDALKAEVKVVSGPATEMKIAGVTLKCIADRLMLGTSTISYSERMQDFFFHIIRLLPHTPIAACGINPWANFPCGTEERWHKIGHKLAPKDLIWDEILEKSGMQSLTIKAPRNGDFPGEINVTLQPTEPNVIRYGLWIRVNYHFPIPNDAGLQRNDKVLSFLKAEWKTATEMPRRIANQIFSKIQ
jgi:hypothetical protein